MMVKLHQSLHVDGKVYPYGVQEIPDEKLLHPHFERYMSLGMVVEADAAEKIVPESLQERGARLAARVKAKAAPVEVEAAEEVAPVVDEDAPVEDESASDEAEVSDDAEQKDAPKKKAKQRK